MSTYANKGNHPDDKIISQLDENNNFVTQPDDNG
jgi:hypothetical protein